MPHMIRIRELIAGGTLGEVRTVIVDHTQKLSTDPAHSLSEALEVSLGGEPVAEVRHPALVDLDVRAADPDRLRGDQQLARPGLRVGALDELDPLAAVELDRPHGRTA